MEKWQYKKPVCKGCGGSENLTLYPKHGLILCEPCSKVIAHILETCQNGVTEKELKRILNVKGKGIEKWHDRAIKGS